VITAIEFPRFSGQYVAVEVEVNTAAMRRDLDDNYSAQRATAAQSAREGAPGWNSQRGADIQAHYEREATERAAVRLESMDAAEIAAATLTPAEIAAARTHLVWEKPARAAQVRARTGHPYIKA
jgi:hypothetical protein